MVELSMGTTAACLPVLGPVISSLRHGTLRADRANERPLVPEQNGSPPSHKKSSPLQSSWSAFKRSHLQGSRQQNALAGFKSLGEDDQPLESGISVPMGAMRSSKVEAQNESFGGIRVTTEMEQYRQDRLTAAS